MEFERKPKFKNNVGKDSDVTHGINLYQTVPYGQLTLEECEDLFRQRLEALNIIEKGDLSDKNLPVLTKSLRELPSFVFKTNCIIQRANDRQQERLDHFSHMLTRMFCVHQSTHWEWFKRNEKKLFYYRLKDKALSLSGIQLEAILKSFHFEFQRVVGSDLEELLREGLIGWSNRDSDKDGIFRVRFTDALKFVARRSVSLKDGFAFLTRYEIISVVCDTFEKHLDAELNYARQHLNSELPQCQQLLESLTLVFQDFEDKLAEEKKNSRANQGHEHNNPYRIDVGDAGSLDQLVKDHYPPCMRYLHDSLKQDHHLKHLGRLHYGTFLRSGGVDMDAAIEFWRREFTKKIPNEKFERDYKYNIRHLYGKEGHKKALTCFSCDKIINDNPPGPSEKHGCPFKHFDDAHLTTLLTKHGLKQVDIDSVMLQRNEKEYKLACSHYFKSIRGDFPTEPIKNPIHYYYESKRFSQRTLTSSEDAEALDKSDVFDDDFVMPKVDI